MLLRMDRRLARIELWAQPGSPLSDADGGQGAPAASSRESTAIPSDRGSPASSSRKAPSAATMGLPLQRVEALVKGAQLRPTEKPNPSRDSCTLTVLQTSGGQDIRLIFEDMVTRDRAYTCLRIFQMSVDNSNESTGILDQEDDRLSNVTVR